jgi:pilus assembly protein CpaE
VTILCELDQAAVAGIAPSLGGAVRHVATLPEAALGVVEDDAENLVVIGRDVPLDQVLDFTAKVLAERPYVSVILVRHEYDQATIAAALGAGVREVVSSSEPAFLLDACRRAVAELTPERSALFDELVPPVEELAPPAEPMAEVEAAPRLGKIVTVFSPKGGSGKTTIATNLAVVLSETNEQVCLVDLDLEFGDVAISLGLTPSRTLADAVKTEVQGDEDDVLRMLTTEYRPGMDCILAPIEPGDAVRIPVSLVTDLLALLKTRYAYVVVDTPSQFSEHVLAALDASDHHVLLTNPEIPALKNLRLTLDMLDLLHYPRERRSIVFNRADSSAGLSVADVEDTIKTAIAVQVPASRDVPASINRGVPIVAGRKDHAVSAAIKGFAAEYIIGVSPDAKKRTRRGFFGRRSA